VSSGFFSRAPVRWTAYVLLGIALGAFTYNVAFRSVDYSPYPATTRAMLGGSRELYGPNSGAGWPMTYRSSPLFPLLFVPLAYFSRPIGAGLWVVLKLICLLFVVRAIRRMARDASGGEEALGSYAWFAVLIPASYVVQEFRSGNMQFFIFALTVAGVYFLRRQPARAGALLGLGTNIKLVPGAFLPYLLFRGHGRAVAWSVAFLALFTLLPAVYFGWQGNLNVLASWWRDGIAEPTPWKWGINPDHSLRGVMRRYLSPVPYEQMPDPNYRNINFANVAPEMLTAAWVVVALAGGLALLWMAWHLRQREKSAPSAAPRTDALEYALLFCASLLLAPLTQRIYMVALLFPAIVLAYELRALSRNLPGAKAIWATALGATALFALPPLVPGRMNQRLIAVVSPDFWGLLLLTLAIALLLRMRLRAESAPAAG
jgi:hypothetical protein